MNTHDLVLSILFADSIIVRQASDYFGRERTLSDHWIGTKELESHGIVVGLMHLKQDRIMIIFRHTQKPHSDRPK